MSIFSYVKLITVRNYIRSVAGTILCMSKENLLPFW